ncbi:MAG TPA: FAD-dependent oxidoreductase, partial [Polyangiaceae bacterium]
NQRSPYLPGPPLQGDFDCDVAIVGGGFTGTSAAYHFARRFPERRIALFEAHSLANGASGRSGGLVLNWMNSQPTADLELTRRIFDTTRCGIDALVRRIREHSLDVRFQRDGCVEILTDPRRADAAAREVERLRSAGIPLRFLHGSELAQLARIEGARGAVLDPTAGRLDGVSLIYAMRPLLLKLGVFIFERTPVLGIQEGQVHTLSVPGARVRAKALVLATNAYTPRLGYFRSGIVPLHSHVLATEALPPEAWREIGWQSLGGFSDDQDRIGYGSMTLGGELVFGGGSNAAYTYRFGSKAEFRGTTERAFAAVERRLHGYFSGIRSRGVRVAHRWTGTVALTMDRVCTMGVLGKYRNVLYALGYSGHGLTLANLAGEVLADIYAGDAARWRGLPFFEHRLPFVPPEPFRWLGYQLYTSLTGRSPRTRTR